MESKLVTKNQVKEQVKKWVCIKCNTLHDGSQDGCPDCHCQYSMKVVA